MSLAGAETRAKNEQQGTQEARFRQFARACRGIIDPTISKRKNCLEQSRVIRSEFLNLVREMRLKSVQADCFLGEIKTIVKRSGRYKAPPHRIYRDQRKSSAAPPNRWT